MDRGLKEDSARDGDRDLLGKGVPGHSESSSREGKIQSPSLSRIGRDKVRLILAEEELD